MVQHSATLLLNSLIRDEFADEAAIRTKKLLSGLQQRHPKVVQFVCAEMSQDDMEISVNEIMLSLAMVRLLSFLSLQALTSMIRTLPILRYLVLSMTTIW